MLAVARERLSEAHYEHALDFIQRTSNALDAPRAFEIYARMHHLSEDDGRALKNRVIASFGLARGEEGDNALATFVAINGDVEWDVTASVLYRLRKRLSGRKNLELRRWVTLHAGHVEARVMKLHVDNALQLVEAAGPDADTDDVVRTYIQGVSARESLYEPILIGVLDRLYADAKERPARPVEPRLENARDPQLRVVGGH
jgi:hypothetical protein